MKDASRLTRDDLVKEISRVSGAIHATHSDNVRVDYIKYLSRLGRELDRRRHIK